ncbi:MAG TPA: amino acid ABC transporter permease [Thermotogota bacterium]|nr:amino acid ABC transporter permease [Thermotogota bacterium]HPJ87763.1 amino acid ABC transporter permease [Thermotogota bacterium]HPR95239.1 amino acid ABC transporter permease [Thermotogota bacterium]
MLNNIIEIVAEHWPDLLEGLGLTLLMALISMSFGTFFGTILAFLKVYSNKVVRAVVTGYIEIIRGTPMLVQIFILYFALPVYGIKLSAFTAAVIGFILNSAAYQAEYTRGAIQSIEKNQMTAARSLGMTKNQAILSIILPQTIKNAIPAWTNEFIYLLKYTSLAYIVGAEELMEKAKVIASRNFLFFEVYVVVAVIYLIIVLLLTWALRKIEQKLDIPGFETVR